MVQYVNGEPMAPRFSPTPYALRPTPSLNPGHHHLLHKLLI